MAECTSAGFDSSLCQAGYNAAFQEHQRTAPQFKTLASCEAEWGSNSCTPAVPQGFGNTTSVFVPLLAGFVLSSMMQQRFYDGGEIDHRLLRRAPLRQSDLPQPQRHQRGPVAQWQQDGIDPVNVNTATVSRSGFGGMGMSRGSSFGS